MKRWIALILAAVLSLSLFACGAEEAEPEAPATRSFTDSLGRTVTLPEELTKVAVSGPMAQIVLFALCPEKLVGISSQWDESAKEILATEFYNLPVLGQLYGGKGELNLETLLSSGAEIVIDIGEPKDSTKEDLDALQEQSGVPFVHVTMATASAGSAYRLLGELLNMPREAEELASYCEKTYQKMTDLASRVEKKRVLYCLGDQGLNVIAQGSYHAELLDLMADNLAVVDDPSSKGTGNEVDMEQILLWDPDVIFFAPDSIYGTVASDPVWQQVSAIQKGTYYKVPLGPYNWLGFPPSVQRYLGLLWMSEVLYPEEAGLDFYSEVATYFDLFYHCDLTQEQYDSLLEGSLT